MPIAFGLGVFVETDEADLLGSLKFHADSRTSRGRGFLGLIDSDVHSESVEVRRLSWFTCERTKLRFSVHTLYITFPILSKIVPGTQLQMFLLYSFT